MVLVAGMAKSGLGAVELLQSKGAHVRASDTRSIAELGSTGQRLTELGIELFPQTDETFTSVDLVVLSPGVPVDALPVVAATRKGIPVIGEVELAGYFLDGPVIGVTGSNGKTTTTALIGHILGDSGISRQVGGNIGTPPTAMIASSHEDQWNVLELSSFQLETIDEFHVNIGVALNVTPDHLDRHGTLERYAEAKGRMFDKQSQDDHAVLNADDAIVSSYAQRTKAALTWFSRAKTLAPGVALNGDDIIYDGVPLIATREIPLRGAHNVENTMAAAAAAALAGAPLQAIADAIRSFPGVEHRLEFVREREGVSYYNDSKATNVDAAEKAIDAFRGGLWIILGGKDKNSDYTVLRPKLEHKAKGILLIGAAAPKIESQLGGLPLISCGAIDKAVEYAAGHASKGDTVLLAPACASFDQFTSYEHRGRVFKDLVKGL
jgi:UDP-N-acetylmuramoylalanine--D-glutamate ligase